ncbi:hypothetical protein ACFPAG_07810 [Vogesella sp. GCM10023246]|uniref:Uncharacterized protein n=1 Tax=Vogesella oryzagri TaxID=3160864 RepID=A0ABV1M2P9_9NEIS
MRAVPKKKSDETGAQIANLLRKCRVQSRKDWDVRLISREIEKAKHADVYDFWKLKSIFELLVGEYDAFKSSFENLLRLDSSRVPEILTYFPLLYSSGYVEDAERLITDRMFVEPLCDLRDLADCLYYSLNLPRFVQLRDLINRTGVSADDGLIGHMENEVASIVHAMPDAPAIVRDVSVLVAKTIRRLGYLIAYRPYYRFDADDDCLYVVFPMPFEFDEVIKLEDEFWSTVDSEGKFADGRVHVSFRVLDAE